MFYSVPWHTEQIGPIFGIPVSWYAKETGFHIFCCDWLSEMGLIADWHHSANERKGLQAGLLAKRMGQRKGWPDLINLRAKLAVELKVGAPVSSDQRAFLAYLDDIGFKTMVCKTFPDFAAFVRSHPCE